jgi:hypothetical protein
MKRDSLAHGPDGGKVGFLQFAAGVGHQLNNPLMAVAGWAELALRRGAPEPALERVLEATGAAAAAVARLEQRLGHDRQARERAFSEEQRWADPLGTLAALSADVVQDLERATDEVVQRARSAAPFIGAKAERVVEQAERARAIARELAASFHRLPAPEPGSD